MSTPPNSNWYRPLKGYTQTPGKPGHYNKKEGSVRYNAGKYDSKSNRIDTKPKTFQNDGYDQYRHGTPSGSSSGFNMDAYKAPAANKKPSAFNAYGGKTGDGAFRAYNQSKPEYVGKPTTRQTSHTTGNKQDGYKTTTNSYYTPAGSQTAQQTTKTTTSPYAGLSMAPGSGREGGGYISHIPGVNPHMPTGGQTTTSTSQQPRDLGNDAMRFNRQTGQWEQDKPRTQGGGRDEGNDAMRFNRQTGQWEQDKPRTTSTSKTNTTSAWSNEQVKGLADRAGDKVLKDNYIPPGYQQGHALGTAGEFSYGPQSSRRVQPKHEGFGFQVDANDPSQASWMGNNYTQTSPGKYSTDTQERTVKYGQAGGSGPTLNETVRRTADIQGMGRTGTSSVNTIRALQNQSSSTPSSSPTSSSTSRQNKSNTTTTTTPGSSYSTTTKGGTTNESTTETGESYTEKGKDIFERISQPPTYSGGGWSDPGEPQVTKTGYGQAEDSGWQGGSSMTVPSTAAPGSQSQAPMTAPMTMASNNTPQGQPAASRSMASMPRENLSVQSTERGQPSVVRGGSESSYQPGTSTTEFGANPNFGMNTAGGGTGPTIAATGGTNNPGIPGFQSQQGKSFDDWMRAFQSGGFNPAPASYSGTTTAPVTQQPQQQTDINQVPPEGGTPYGYDPNQDGRDSMSYEEFLSDVFPESSHEQAKRAMIENDALPDFYTDKSGLKRAVNPPQQTDLNQVPAQEPTFAEMDRATRYGGDDEFYAAKEKRYRDYFLRLGEEQVKKRNELNPDATPLRPDQAQIEVELNGKRVKMTPAYAAMHSIRTDKQNLEAARKLEAEKQQSNQTDINQVPPQGGTPVRSQEPTFAEMDMATRYGSDDEPQSSKYNRYLEYALDQARQIAEGKNRLYTSQGGEPAYTAQNVFVPVTTGIMAGNNQGIMNLRPEEAARRMILEDKTALEITRRKQEEEEYLANWKSTGEQTKSAFEAMPLEDRVGSTDESYGQKLRRYEDYYASFRSGGNTHRGTKDNSISAYDPGLGRNVTSNYQNFAKSALQSDIRRLKEQQAAETQLPAVQEPAAPAPPPQTDQRFEDTVGNNYGMGYGEGTPIAKSQPSGLMLAPGDELTDQQKDWYKETSGRPSQPTSTAEPQWMNDALPSPQAQAAFDMMQTSPASQMQNYGNSLAPSFEEFYAQASSDDANLAANQSIIRDFPEFAQEQSVSVPQQAIQTINVDGGEKAGEYSDRLQDVVGIDLQQSIYDQRRQQAMNAQPVQVSASKEGNANNTIFTKEAEAPSVSDSSASPESGSSELPVQQGVDFEATQRAQAAPGTFQMSGTQNDQTWDFDNSIDTQALAQAYMSPDFAPAGAAPEAAPSVYQQALNQYQEQFPDQPSNFGRRTTTLDAAGNQIGQSTGYSNEAEAGRLNYQDALINRINKSRRPHFKSLGFNSPDLNVNELISGARQDVSDGFTTQFLRDAIASGVDPTDPALTGRLDEMLGINNADFNLDENGNPMYQEDTDISKYLPPVVQQTEWTTPGVDVRYGRPNKPENEGQWINPVDAFGNPVKRKNLFGYGPGRVENTGDQLVSSNVPR